MQRTLTMAVSNYPAEREQATMANYYRNQSHKGPITDAQRRFITSLLSERLVTLGFPTVQDASEALSLHDVDMSVASTLIERLKAMATDPDPTMPQVVASAARKGKGNRPGRCAGCGHVVGQDEGFYFLTSDGRWTVHHKVDECRAVPAPAPVEVHEGLYKTGEQIVLVYKTRNGRLAGKVMNVRGKFCYQQGALSIAAAGAPLTAEEAAAYGKLTGRCVACSRDLTDERSLHVGYGPVCASKYGWPWGAA